MDANQANKELQNMKKTSKGCCLAGVIAIVLLLIVICWPTSESSEDRRTMAWIMATRHFVPNELAVPGSAKFPAMSDSGVVMYDNGDSTYNILGYVDSQNHFGAFIRMQFSCVVRDNGGGSWDCLSIELHK